MMSQPYFREAGAGPSVVCIHSGFGSSGQWRTLTEQLTRHFRVIACDMSGSGKSPASAYDGAYDLDAELAFLDPVFRAAGESFHVIGHSFGGAVAIKAALRRPRQVRSLVLFEATLFALLVRRSPESAEALEILDHRESTSRLAETGQADAAALRFVDYWFYAGRWASMPDSARADVRRQMPLVRPRWDALFCDPISVEEIASIEVPVLYLTGARSNAPTRALGALITNLLPRARAVELEDAGHMALVEQPQRVNPIIEAFLREVEVTVSGDQ